MEQGMWKGGREFGNGFWFWCSGYYEVGVAFVLVITEIIVPGVLCNSNKAGNSNCVTCSGGV